MSGFETVACAVCGSESYEKALEVGDRFNTIPGQVFNIVKCGSCGLLFVNPRPDQDSIAEYYESEEYDPFGSASSKDSAFTRLYRIARPFSIRRKAARVVKGLAPRARTLDVGCATGEFVRELRRRGFTPFGVEPDSQAAEYARQKNGLTVWTGTIEQVPKIAGPFGLITFWHVLEHVHTLRETLSCAYSLLDKGGRVAIAVPNPESCDARIYGAKWVAWDAPRHLYHFTSSVMVDLLTKSGFRSVRLGAVAFDAFYHSLLSESKTTFGLMRGGIRGLSSYLRGISGGAGSSELYLAYKD